MYYTDVRARDSISVTTDTSGDRRGSLDYNPTTGVISYEGVTQAEIRGDISAVNDNNTGYGQVNYDPSTGQISLSGTTTSDIRGDISAANTSNGYGSINYTPTTGKITFTKITDSSIRGAISAKDSSDVTYNSNNGEIDYTEHIMSTGLITSGGNNRTVKVKAHTGVTVDTNGVSIPQEIETSSDVQFNKVTAGNFNTTSDVSLKNNIHHITTPLEKVQALNGVSFNWNNRSKDRQYGMIANDVEQIIPEAVATDQQGLRSIDYSAVVAHLVEAVKDLSDKVNRLSS